MINSLILIKQKATVGLTVTFRKIDFAILRKAGIKGDSREYKRGYIP